MFTSWKKKAANKRLEARASVYRPLCGDTLAEFLGMTPKEFKNWKENGEPPEWML